MIFTMNRLVNGLSKNGFDELYHVSEGPRCENCTALNARTEAFMRGIGLI